MAWGVEIPRRYGRGPGFSHVGILCAAACNGKNELPLLSPRVAGLDLILGVDRARGGGGSQLEGPSGAAGEGGVSARRAQIGAREGREAQTLTPSDW